MTDPKIIEQNFDIQEFNTFIEELITCENCGHEWDGYAQCMCMGIVESDYDEELIEHTEILDKQPKRMTLRSDKLLKHPEYWTKEKHYGDKGQCGQSCPCCRSDVGDILGSCDICNKK